MQRDKFSYGTKIPWNVLFLQNQAWFPPPPSSQNVSIQFSIEENKQTKEIRWIDCIYFLLFLEEIMKEMSKKNSTSLYMRTNIILKSAWNGLIVLKKIFCFARSITTLCLCFLPLWNKANLELQPYRNCETGRKLWRPRGAVFCFKQS